MDLMGDLLGALSTHGAPPSGADPTVYKGLVEHVLGMANNAQSGGLGGLISKLNSGGLSSLASSWVSNNPNQPASADQIVSALGSDHIAELAQKFGIPPGEVASHLSQILPVVINHLTPNGSVPDQGLVASAIGLLKGKLLG